GGTVMHYSDGKRHLCFSILSAWIVDHAKQATLHGISNKSCLKCEVTSDKVGRDPQRIYNIHDYTVSAKTVMEYGGTGTASITQHFQHIGVKIGRTTFSGLHCIDPVDLHKPDLLHNIYLGLF